MGVAFRVLELRLWVWSFGFRAYTDGLFRRLELKRISMYNLLNVQPLALKPTIWGHAVFIFADLGWRVDGVRASCAGMQP